MRGRRANIYLLLLVMKDGSKPESHEVWGKSNVKPRIKELFNSEKHHQAIIVDFLDSREFAYEVRTPEELSQPAPKKAGAQ